MVYVLAPLQDGPRLAFWRKPWQGIGDNYVIVTPASFGRIDDKLLDCFKADILVVANRPAPMLTDVGSVGQFTSLGSVGLTLYDRYH